MQFSALYSEYGSERVAKLHVREVSGTRAICTKLSRVSNVYVLLLLQSVQC